MVMMLYIRFMKDSGKRFINYNINLLSIPIKYPLKYIVNNDKIS